ncbi:FAD-dependent oxidoreductase [Parvularcula maris]|uniref:FAD-dependent monooxygenase n=1 Tax=Parvularcula maris TaxID=2965077 RepID=A0A9X2L6G1_9PROT|nr:FAD-dependent oxidoreductase [Parvularcula maris]MCQ8183979.1 FAD-dependent monooxygenase [Parvularcula maris]
MTERHDVCVVGAGLTGRLLALALAHQGLDVMLADRAEAGTPSDDGRTTALAYASVRLFKRLGLWETLGPKAEPITDILVSNGEPRDRFRRGGLFGGQLHFPSTLLGNTPEESEPALGYIVENKDMVEAMRAASEASPIIERYRAEVDHYDTSEPGCGTVHFTNGECAEVALVAACDGRRSPLRQQAGLKTLGWHYNQRAIIVNLSCEKPHHGVAHEVFYPDGPFAILPMRGNMVSIVWTEKEAAAKSYLALDDEAFLAAVAERVGDHLGKLTLASKRQSFPLSLLYAPKLTAERLVLAGDAAHGIHPIAGQGFNLGVKDVAALADVLCKARQTGLDLGHGTVLARYDRWRRFDSTALALGTDSLVRLFSGSFAPLKHARGLGLGLVQRSDMARRFFMRVSGADLGELPRLMQPL